jgi:hypothetical protein
MRTNALAVLALMLALVLAAGCSRGTSGGKQFAEKQMEKVLEQGGAKHADVDLGGGGGVDISGLPEEFRQPGAVGIGHVGGGAASGETDTYILQTNESPGAVLAGYKQRLAAWKQVAFMESPAATSINYESPDGTRQASVLVGTERNSGKTNISISLTGK